MESSKVVSTFYSGITPTPRISLESGEYEAGQPVIITVDPSVLDWDNLFIRYTLDGSEPGDSSSVFEAQIILTDDCLLKATTFYLNWNPSPVVSAQYSISTPVVETPHNITSLGCLPDTDPRNPDLPHFQCRHPLYHERRRTHPGFPLV